MQKYSDAFGKEYKLKIILKQTDIIYNIFLADKYIGNFKCPMVKITLFILGVLYFSL